MTGLNDDPFAADEALIAAMEDMSPAMAEAEEILAEAIDSNFETQSAAGEPWPSLAFSTVADRVRHGYGGQGPILERDGGLRREATSVREHDHESAQVGAPDDSIAKYHVDPGEREKIPRRDFLVIDEATAEKVDAAIDAHLMKAAG